MFISKGFLKQIEVKIIGKNARPFDRTSVIIKPKSEDKICIHININYLKIVQLTIVEIVHQSWIHKLHHLAISKRLRKKKLTELS